MNLMASDDLAGQKSQQNLQEFMQKMQQKEMMAQQQMRQKEQMHQQKLTQSGGGNGSDPGRDSGMA